MNTPTATKSRDQLTSQAAKTAIDAACRTLRLPTIREIAEDHIRDATRNHTSYAGFLSELLLAECDQRDQRATSNRIRTAGFPRLKYLADFDYNANPAINPATIGELATC